MSTVLPGSSGRFGIAIAVSALANLLLWFSLSQLSSRVVSFRPPPVLEFSRVTMDAKHVLHEKVIKPKEVKKRVEPVKPPIAQKEPVHTQQKPPPPEGAHNRVVTSKTPAPNPDDHAFTAPTGGNAPVGVPTEQQPGNNTVNPPTPPVTPPVQPPAPTPEKHDDTPPVAPVKHDDPAPPVTPPAPPKPKGPTSDAEPSHTADVEIPDNLKDQTFKTHVHVKVNVSADGTFEVVLRTTSGNPDIDKLVLDCLKKWKWKPALKDGEPVDSSHLFNFEFEVK